MGGSNVPEEKGRSLGGGPKSYEGDREKPQKHYF